MPLSITENELQSKLIALIKNNLFLSRIRGREILEAQLLQDRSDSFIPSFLVDYKLEKEYARGALRVLEALEDYKIITGESIRNISLETNDAHVRELLYPDIVLFNEKTRQLIILELKKDGQTERQAVTELAAYVQEVKNHLPFSSDLDVLLVLVAADYSTLLNHAVSGLVIDTRYNILCLNVELNANNEPALSVHRPHAAWTDIGQGFTDENTFITETILLKPKVASSPEGNGLLGLSSSDNDKVDMAIDMVMHKAVKYNTHGFLFKTGAIADNQKCFGISLSLLNPYVFLQYGLNNEFILNDGQPLAEYLKAEQLGEDKMQKTVSLTKLTHLLKEILSADFEITVDEMTTYGKNMQLHSDFRIKHRPILFDSWGAVGDYVRHLYFHPAFRSQYLVAGEYNLSLNYKDPFLGIQIINLITGNYLFRDGQFNARDTYRFCKLLSFYQQRHTEKLMDKPPVENQDSSLIYSMAELTMALKEFGFRLKGIQSDNAVALPVMTLSPFKLEHDFYYEIKEFTNWHVNCFTSESAVVTKLLIKSCYEAAAYFNTHNNLPEEERRRLAKEVSDFIRMILLDYISGVYISKEQQKNEMVDKLISEVYFKEKLTGKNAGAAITEIYKLDEVFLLGTFESHFIPIADELIDEVFHSLHTTAEMFASTDWRSLKERILTRVRRGEKDLVIGIDSAGNFGISTMDETERKLFANQVYNYEEEVYFVNEMAGLRTIAKVKWADLISGEFFKGFNLDSGQSGANED